MRKFLLHTATLLLTLLPLLEQVTAQTSGQAQAQMQTQTQTQTQTETQFSQDLTVVEADTDFKPFNPVMTNSSFWSANTVGFDKTSVQLSGRFTSASDVMTQAFVNKLFFGGFLDDELKNDVLDKASLSNRLGFELESELLLSVPVAERMKVNVAFGRSWVEAQQFSDDLFELLFFGNANRVDEEMLLGDFEVTNQLYQYLQAGLMGQNGDFGWGASLSLLQGITYQQGEISLGSLYTAADVSYLDLAIQGDFKTTTTVPSGSAFNGLGLAGALHFNYRSSNWLVGLDLEDIGFINWEDRAEQYTADSTYRYDGFEVNELLDLANDPISTERDSLLSYLGLTAEQGSFSAPIPGTYRIHLTRMFPQSQLFALTAGMEHRTHASYLPLVYVKGNWSPSDAFVLGSHFSFGGYMGFQWGVEAVFPELLDLAYLQLGATNLLGLAAPGTSSLGSIYATLALSF